MTLTYLTPLSLDQQIAHGVTSPQPLAVADRVRFSELDMLGHVNNTRYFEWFERTRVRYSQEWGISHYVKQADAPRIVIRSGAIHYRQEMLMDEDYIVTCRCAAFRTTSYSLHQQIWAGGSLRATFDCVLVLLERDKSGRLPIPTAVRTRFTEIDGAHPES